jgi:hypothetical protein
MRAALIVAACIPAAARMYSQKASFDPVAQEIVEQRIRAFTTSNETRFTSLRKLFEDAGCTGDALSEHAVKGSHLPNLVCTYPGSESTIIVGAHFDLAEKGQGVIDNWSGASLLPSLYQGLTKSSRRHTFTFVGFVGEEKGLVGSKAYVKELNGGLAQVRAMVNLDTLGLSDTKVWVHHADPELVKLLAASARALELPAAEVDVEKVGSSDSESFRERKIPAITIHSLTNNTLRILHSPADRIEALKMDEYYRSYRLILGYLAVLDQKLN